jgi:serine protease inhibitor
LVISPFSLQTALAMLTSGASKNSTTKKQLLAALGDIQSFDNFEKKFADLLEYYKVKARFGLLRLKNL